MIFNNLPKKLTLTMKENLLQLVFEDELHMNFIDMALG
jgi:hypothetical protein